MFAVLETLRSLDIPMPECNDLIRTDVTEMHLQCPQPPCFVPSVPDLGKHECTPHKKARLEKKEIVSQKKLSKGCPLISLS
jgi:hypothetical protein